MQDVTEVNIGIFGDPAAVALSVSAAHALIDDILQVRGGLQYFRRIIIGTETEQRAVR